MTFREWALSNLEDYNEEMLEYNESIDCSNLGLTSLEGAPKIVNGYFDCSNNNLISLEGAPTIVNGWFSCSYNKLTSLSGASILINGGSFYCSNNKLISLKGNDILLLDKLSSFNCSHNNLTSLEGAPNVLRVVCYSNLLTEWNPPHYYEETQSDFPVEVIQQYNEKHYPEYLY